MAEVINPENRDIIDPEQLQAEQSVLQFRRLQLSNAKHDAREQGSYHDVLADHVRLMYLLARDRYLCMNARKIADDRSIDHPGVGGSRYRELISQTVAQSLTDEEKTLESHEVERTQHYPHDVIAQLRRHPGVRAAAGLGSTLAVSGALLSDVWPWSLPLGIAVGATSWVGLDGAIQGIRDYWATRFGLRSRPENLNSLSLEETETRLAHIQENRVEHGIIGESPLERDLLQRREEIIRGRLNNSLQASNTLWRTWSGDKVAAKLRSAYDTTGENLSFLKQQVLQQNRVARILRLGAAGILGLGTTLLVGTLTLPEAQAPYVDKDLYFERIMGNGDVSSRHGLIQAVIAREVVGISDFDPSNTNHLSRYYEWEEKYPLKASRLKAGFDRWFERHNRSQTEDGEDLISHKNKHMLPKDPKHFAQGMLGQYQSPLDHLRFATYRW